MIPHSLKVGLSFGLTSGVITTLGLIVGLNAASHSKLVIFGGILTIAIADALSDALGIHISEEAEGVHSRMEIWQSTFATLISKFFFSLSFLIPLILFDLDKAILVSILWGLLVLAVYSYHIAKKEGSRPYKAVLEHLAIAVTVIFLTNNVGEWISEYFIGVM